MMNPIRVTTDAETKRYINPLEFTKELNYSNDNYSDIIVIASGKGGVGKTLVAANIGYYLTQKNKKVTIVDFDFASPSLHTLFNINNPQKTLKQVIYDPDFNLNDFAYETGIKNLKLICGCSDTLGMIEKSDLIVSRLIESAKHLQTDYVIFDLGTGLNKFDTKLFLQAKTGILIGTPEPTAILENFSFLKLCILQRLEQIYKGQRKEINIIREAYNNYNTKINEQIKSLIKDLNRKSAIRYLNDALHFYPEFILNMVHDDSDYPYALAIDIAIKEMFGLKLKHLGTIPFCTQMRSSMMSNSIGSILNNENGAKTCYQNITKKLINNWGKETLANQAIKIGKLTHLNDDFSENNANLFCSSNCTLWNNCSYQHGGYPCKIKYIGFINTN